MIYTTRTIDNTRTPLLVGDFLYDGSVIARTPQGEILRVPRFWIETPVLSCDKCGKHALLKFDRRKRKDYVECPDHARHMYEVLFAGSHDVKQYSRKQRRQFHAEAGRWLSVWQRKFESNVAQTKKQVENAVQQAAGEGK